MTIAATLAVLFVFVFLLAAAAVIGGRRILDTWDEVPRIVEAEGPEIDWNSPVSPLLLKEDALSTISFWHRLLNRVDGIERIKVSLAESGLPWSVGRLTAMMLFCGASAFAVLWKLAWVNSLVALGLALFASLVPYAVVVRRRSQRIRQLEEQFPEALDSLARALRAGNTLAGGFEMLARETPQPLAGEFRKTLDERNLGTNWDQALDHLAHRIPVVDVSLFAAATQMQSRTGGKLHEVLTKLAENMRESAALRQEVRAISAHGKLTGLILTLLPAGIGVMMMIVNPSHMMVLFYDPTGRTLLIAAACCLVLAHFVIGKLVEIKI